MYIGHHIFKELIKICHPVPTVASTPPPSLIYNERNALRYVAGYIPRLLKKKLSTSSHPLKKDIILCISDLLADDGDEEDDDDDSHDWVDLVDRGDLTLVNNKTFDVFVAIEYEVRNRLGKDMELTDAVMKEIAESDQVAFFWSLLNEEWQEESSVALLHMVVSQFLKIRGFSYASSWIENFKATHFQELVGYYF